ncbi:MAG: long-chain fatty acid--CoA ligase, partial [Pseudomonadota bacterium]|nr:long-chain fatty acid--CoA ligase [Pseudomonadota bacterium]
GAVAEEEGLMSLCRERLANFKVPRAVRWVDSLPMNASGKVLKYKLKERAHDATTS